MAKPTGLDADNELQTLPAADLVVSVDEVRARLQELAAPVRDSVAASRWDAYFGDVTDRLLDAAARVLDAAAPAPR